MFRLRLKVFINEDLICFTYVVAKPQMIYLLTVKFVVFTLSAKQNKTETQQK